MDVTEQLCAQSLVPGKSKGLSVTQAASFTPTMWSLRIYLYLPPRWSFPGARENPASTLGALKPSTDTQRRHYWVAPETWLMSWDMIPTWRRPFFKIFFWFFEKVEISPFLCFRSEGISFALEREETSVTYKRRNSLDYPDAQWLILSYRTSWNEVRLLCRRVGLSSLIVYS